MIYLCDPSRSLEFIHSVAFAGSLLTIGPSAHLVIIFYIYTGLCAFQVQYKLIHLIFLSHDSCLQCWFGLIPASQAFQQWNCYLTNYLSKSRWGTGGWAPLSVLTGSSCHSSERALGLSAAEERDLVCFRVLTRDKTVFRNRNTSPLIHEKQSAICVSILPTRDEANIGPILSPFAALSDALMHCGVCGHAFRDYLY